MPVIEAQDVCIRYRVANERIPTFKEFAIQWLRGRVVYRDVHALSHLTLQVEPGESIGIIGRNGAGKTTLLKVIARVLRPTCGRIETRGRVAPLLDLGAGFDHELTGRENIFLNGAILGRSHREIASRLDSIVEFAELAQFIDAPLRTYSTGMVARLGFSVATDVQPDVLLVDEVLSVGDVGFQQKCHVRIHEFRSRGATLVLVSHSPETIQSLCSRVIWLDAGRIVADGPPAEVLPAFLSRMNPSAPECAAVS